MKRERIEMLIKKVRFLFVVCIIHLNVLSIPALSAAPRWAETNKHSKYPPQWFFIGVGISSAGLQDARNDARLEIAKQIKIQIKAKTQRIVEEQQISSSQVGEQYYLRRQMESKSESLVNQSFSGTRIIETAKDGNIFYALAILDRRKFGNRIEAEIEQGIQTIDRLSSDTSKFLRDGKIVPAIDNLIEAHDISYELISKQTLHSIVSPIPLVSDEIVAPSVLLSEIRGILSNIRFNKIGGDRQTGKVGASLDQELSVKLTFSEDRDESVPVSGIPIRFKYGDGEKIDDRITDEDGVASIQPIVRIVGRTDSAQITAKPRLRNIPPDLQRALPINDIVFSYHIKLDKAFPVQLIVESEDDSNVPELKRQLTRQISGMGYSVKKNADITIRGELSVADVKEIGGLRPKVMVSLELNVSILDQAQSVLDQIVFSSNGLDTTEKKAIQKGLRRFKFSKHKLLELLQSAQKLPPESGEGDSISVPATSSGLPAIHALLIIMDSDPKIGESTKLDLIRVQTAIQTLKSDAVLDVKILSSMNALYKNETVTPQQVQDWIESLKIASDDTIVIYYSGHGYMDQDENHYLAFNPRSPNSMDDMSREEIIQSLKKKPCRLKMLITDCCSNKIDISGGAGRDIEIVSESLIYAINLFLEHKGVLNINSSSEGEVAWGNNSIGGYFTMSLFEAFNGDSDANGDDFLSWEEVFEVAKRETASLFDQTTFSPLQKAQLQQAGQRSQTPKAYSALPLRIED